MAEAASWTDRRWRTPSRAVVGWALSGVAALAFVTLCPIGLRPHVMDANAERLCAYLIVGLLISRAAGRRALAAMLSVLVLAFGLEASQMLVASRHAVMADALVKAFGGVAGVAAHQLGFPLRRLIMRRAKGLEGPRWLYAGSR